MPERKTKAPDDPTIFVGGKPKIDINANKLQINEFLKRHKVIKPSQGGKRKSLTQLRQELIDGGHVVGVKGKTGTTKTKGGGARKQGEEDKKKQEEYKKVLKANPQGFNVKNVNPIGFTIRGFNNPIDAYKPTTDEIFSSGYGGIPIRSNPASGVSSPRLELEEDYYLKTVSEMRDYLTSRVPVEDFRDLRKAELREFYDKVREKRGEEEDYSEGKSVAEMKAELIMNSGVNLEGLSKREIRIQYNKMVAVKLGQTDTTDYSKGMKISDMRDYLSSKIPNTVFKDMRKGQIKELYNREKRIENRQVPEKLVDDDLSPEVYIAAGRDVDTDEESIDPDDIVADFSEEEELDILELDYSDDIITEEKYTKEKARLLGRIEERKEERELMTQYIAATDAVFEAEEKAKQEREAQEEIIRQEQRLRNLRETYDNPRAFPARRRVAAVELGLPPPPDLVAKGRGTIQEELARTFSPDEEDDDDEPLTLDDMKEFEYEGVTYYYHGGELLEEGIEVFNEKLDIVGRLGEKTGAKVYQGGGYYQDEHEIIFKNKEYEDHHILWAG